MIYDKLKKTLLAIALISGFIFSMGAANGSVASAQYRDRRSGWHERNRDRDDLFRVRRLDRDQRVRYRTNGATRLVGYYDRFGRFHAYGFYDRVGRFHRY